jgi:diacylglycerol kinase family enzyme/membrane-associated phospholipid phosphatase
MPISRALTRAVDTVATADAEAMRSIASYRAPAAVDQGMRALTRAADHSKLWMGLGAVLFATGNRRARRAAARGLGSLAVSSLLANQLGKRAVPRRRPLAASTPLARLAHRFPTSSSFPSGHSASAAAFAVGAAIELPELAVPLAVTAGAVAFSRVYTGVHFPSDVLAGVAVGAAVAGVGGAIVPARHREPTRAGDEPGRPQPPRTTGQAVVAVINPASGPQDAASFLTDLRRALPDATTIELAEDDDMEKVMREAAANADVLAVVGGDGTVNAAATAAIEADKPLLVLPAGTFNHFARDLDLAEFDDAVEAVWAGRAVRIDVGDVNGQLFVNTASLGSYPEFVEARERLERRLGKPLAAAVALGRIVHRGQPLTADLDGRRRELAMIFIGSNAYEPPAFAPRWRQRMDSGDLDVRYLDVSGHSSIRLALLTLAGQLHRTGRYTASRRPELRVVLPADRGSLARDGEVGGAPREVTFTMRRHALTVYRGRPASSR